MTIIEEAKSTLALLKRVNAASTGADEAEAIGLLTNELKTYSTRINSLVRNASLFRQQGVKLSPLPDLRSALEALKNNKERFAENQKATTLRQGTRWTTLTKKLASLVETGESTQASDWKTFFENNYFGGPTPAQLQARLAATPENMKRLEQYRARYQAFNKYRTQPPKDEDEFSSLRELSSQLAEITFQEDVPEAVARFIAATNFGASLDLLTPEVLTWLSENKLLSNYVVRAKTS